MDDGGLGPFNPKKRKIVCKNPKKLREDELLAVLEASIDEYWSDDDDNYQSDDSEAETTDDDDELHMLGQGIAPASTIPNWSSHPMHMKNFQFSKTNELLLPIPGNNEPVDFFRAIFDDEILDLIVTETNRYAEEVFLSEGTTEKSRITKWKPVTSDEMLTFIALVVHTGTIKLNRLQDYWKGHPLFNLKCFSQHMSRDQFLLIMRCLHFAKNSHPGQDVPRDRLYKIRPVMDFFNNKMATLYYPGKELSLDESAVLWRGRLVFRQYLPNKRHKYAIKLYMVTEPNGVILKLLVYSGALDECGGKGHTAKVVLELMANYLNSGHSVYLDNYYNSFELANELTRRNTYCTGTLNAKRVNNPKELVVEKNLKRGERVAAYSNNIMVAKWKDKRDVLYISNEYDDSMIEYVDRRNRERVKPTAIFYYNKYMGGIDKQDQLTAYYPCDRKTLRWYKKLGIHFIHLMFINAFLLYKKYSGRNITLYDFRLSVLEQLLHVEVIRTPKTRDQRQHVLTKITATNAKGETKRKRCRVCSQSNIRKMTLYHCELCPQQPGFCVGECFAIFHM